MELVEREVEEKVVMELEREDLDEKEEERREKE